MSVIIINCRGFDGATSSSNFSDCLYFFKLSWLEKTTAIQHFFFLDHWSLSQNKLIYKFQSILIWCLCLIPMIYGSLSLYRPLYCILEYLQMFIQIESLNHYFVKQKMNLQEILCTQQALCVSSSFHWHKSTFQKAKWKMRHHIKHL